MIHPRPSAFYAAVVWRDMVIGIRFGTKTSAFHTLFVIIKQHILVVCACPKTFRMIAVISLHDPRGKLL